MKTIGRGLALWAFVVALVVSAGVAVDNSAAQVGTKAKEKVREKATEREAGELRFEIYTDRSGKYRWRLFAGDGREIAMSVSGYTDEADARSAIEAIRKGAARARVEDASATTKK